MVSKKKIIKFKLNFHKSPRRRKTPYASRMSNKSNSSRLMVNTKTLPRVHVSLTRLMPTKMPNIAKNQYYNLVKSSGLLSVLPADKATWDGLSPEATPEREFSMSSCNSDLLSPITRTQLQLSPFDLEDADYTDLGNEPWSDNSEPYPSPKSPENDENEQTVCWLESPEVNNTCSFKHQEGVGLSPCDSEVEAIMARQNCEVAEEVPDIPVHRPQPSNSLLQTIIIPLEPVEKSPCSLDVSRDDSPVFDRDGIWTSPGRKWSEEKTKAVGKVGLKRKRGRPKKNQNVPRLTTSVDLSLSVPTNDVQGTDQENNEERTTNPEEVTSSTSGTELPSETSCVENGTSRPRKCRRLHDDPVPNNSVGVDLSNENARSTLICPPETRAEAETSQEVNKNLEKEESPVILEQAVDINYSTLQERSRKSTDVTEHKKSANIETYVNSQIEAHPTQESRLTNEQTLLLSARKTFSQSNDLDSMEEIASERIQEEDDERVQETPVTPPSKWLSAVHIESSPLIKSLEFNEIINGEKSPIRSTVFLASQGDKHQFSFNSESTNESAQQDRLRSLRQELLPEKELDTSANVWNCQLRSRTLSETSELSVSLRPLEVRLSTSLSEDAPVLNKEDKSRECLGSLGEKTSPLKGLSVVCERLPNSVVDNNDICSSSSLLENSTSNENINIRSEVTKRSLSFVRGCQSDKTSSLPGKRKPSVLCANDKDKDSDQRQNELLEGKVALIPCSPIRILNSPFKGRLRKRSCSSIGSSKSDTPYSSTTTRIWGDKETSKKSSGRPKKKSMDNSLPQNLRPPLSPSKSNTSLLDGTVRLTPCSPVQAVQISTMWKKGKRGEKRNSAVRTSPTLNSASKTASPPNAFKSPVPLKDLVVKCDRVPASDYNVLKSPENVLVKPTRPKRTRNKRQVNVENNDTDNKGKKKTGTKRKIESKSPKSEKPKKKKRKLTIPDHYKNYKPCQLPSISHTQMRYRVAFNLWPQKFSGALDKINQRLINQNAFWKSLG